MEQPNGKKMPEKTFRAGAISATIWANDGKSKTTGETVSYNTISLQRSYKDKDDKWQTTSSMRLNDLPRAALVLERAYSYLVLNGQDSAVECVI